METGVQKIVPFLWFDGQAEEAANYYVSIFDNSKILSVVRYGDVGPGPKGEVMFVTFQLEGQDFYALNGNKTFKFSLAISLFVKCKTQKEIDELWERLSEGGEKIECGWLKDKFGVAWQIVPAVIGEMLADKNAKKSQSVMKAIMKMKKLEIEGLKQAFERA